ncbi:MAG: DUF6382 domain-containing protein, partial [Lachnospiraceae bacterium]|nr:DUF6382 domain-containing protein [Lachnospiraceae bacterium]
MNISFKKNINRNYMVIENVSEFKENNFKVQMLLNNRITGILKFDYEVINGEVNFLYDVSSKQALSKQYEKRRMSFDNLRVLLLSLKTMIYALDEYLLDPDDVNIKKECIFVDQSENNFEFCYYPFYNGNIVLELRELFGNILPIVNYEDERAVRLAYELYEKTQNDSFTISDLLEILSEENTKGFIMMDIPEDVSFEEQETSPAILKESEKKVYSGEVEDPSFFVKLSRYLKGRGVLDVLEDINNGEFMDRVREYGYGEEFSYKNIMNTYAVETVKEEADYDLGLEFF